MFKKKGSIGLSVNKPIVTLDPYLQETFLFKDNSFTKPLSKSLSKDSNFVISFIHGKDVISGTIEIARNVADDELDDAIEIKVYDELGLDSSVEYKIYHFESHKQDTNERSFDVIAVDEETLYNIFSEVKHIKYIDYITTAPLLFKSLYTKGILEPNSVECFIHFHKDDTHVTIYEDGEFVFSKSIRYSLSVISDTFSKELGKRVDEAEFYKMLQTNGLHNQDPAYQKVLMKLFGEVFVYINDVILYAKRAYSLEKIDKIYLSSDLGNIKGFEEFCVNYVNIPSESLKVKIAKNSDELNVNPIHSLMVLSAQHAMGDLDSDINLSIFKKPPPFKSRPSGKLAQVAAAALFLSLAYPAYQFGKDQLFLKRDLSRLNSEYADLSSKSKNMKEEFSKLKVAHEKVDKKLSAKEEELDFRTKLLHEIYMKKVSYPMKAKIMTSLFDKITKHNSKVVAVDNNASTMVITVRSNNDKSITELLDEIASYNEYDVSTDTIKKDDNGTYYESAIKVGLNVR